MHMNNRCVVELVEQVLAVRVDIDQPAPVEAPGLVRKPSLWRCGLHMTAGEPAGMVARNTMNGMPFRHGDLQAPQLTSFSATFAGAFRIKRHF